jgi:hypothetical protein
MVGYFLGLDVGKSSFEGSFKGNQDDIGASVGGYFVTEINPRLFLDGYTSYGISSNNLKLDNGTLNIVSDYKTTSTSFGGSLMGVVPVNSYTVGSDGKDHNLVYYEIWPEIQFSHGKTEIGKMDFTGRAYGMIDNTLSIDKTTVSRTSAGFKPHFKFPMDNQLISDSKSVMSFSPGVKYEKTTTTSSKSNFGGGFEVGHTKTSNDGTGALNVKIMLDRIGSTTSGGFKLKYDKRF